MTDFEQPVRLRDDRDVTPVRAPTVRPRPIQAAPREPVAVGALDATLGHQHGGRIRRATVSIATQPAAGMARRSDEVVQRTPVAQLAMSGTAGAQTISGVRVSGRPERTFGSSMGDHTTAWTVHVNAVINALREQTPVAGLAAIVALADGLQHLPGHASIASLPPTQRALHDAAMLRLQDARALLVPQPPAAPDRQVALLQQLVVAYLEARETIPLSTINRSAVSNATSGKTKGERGSQLLQLAATSNGRSPDVIRATIARLFDASAVALVGAFWDSGRLGTVAPGLDSALGPAARIRLYAQQHVDSIRQGFPQLFDAPGAAAGGDEDMAVEPSTVSPATMVEHLVALTTPDVKVALAADHDGLVRSRDGVMRDWLTTRNQRADVAAGLSELSPKEREQDRARLGALDRQAAAYAARFNGWNRDITALHTFAGQPVPTLPVLVDPRRADAVVTRRANTRPKIFDPSPPPSKKRKRPAADEASPKKQRGDENTDVAAVDDTLTLERVAAAAEVAPDDPTLLAAPEEDEDTVAPEEWTADLAETTADADIAPPSRIGSLAVQVTVDPVHDVVTEVHIEGRPKPQHDGSHGAHVTAFLVHADRVRNGLRACPFDQVDARLATMEAEADASYVRLTGGPAPAWMRPNAAAGGIAAVQERIANHLVFIDHIPGASLSAAKPDGRGEGAHRATLMAFHRASVALGAQPMVVAPHRRQELHEAICGLLDLKVALEPTPSFDAHGNFVADVPPDQGLIDTYIDNHLLAVDAAYPGVCAAARADAASVALAVGA